MKPQTLILAGALYLAVALAPFSAQAAITMVLDLGSDTPGESQVDGHANQIDVLSWSWGLSNSGSVAGAVGKANFQDLSLTKYVDKSSPKLMLDCASGAHLPTATLYCLKSIGAGKPYEYVKITLTEVQVTSVSTGGSGGQDRLTENVTLNFAKVKYDYQTQNPDGSPGSTVSFTWNVANNLPN